MRVNRRRFLGTIGVLAISSIAAFFVLAASPHGPPAWGYFGWLFGALHGDLGWSVSHTEPVSTAIAGQLPAWVAFVTLDFAATVVVGAALGYARSCARAAAWRGTLRATELAGRSIPLIPFALCLPLWLLAGAWLPHGTPSARGIGLEEETLALAIFAVICVAVPFGTWSSTIFADAFHTRPGGVQRWVVLRRAVAEVASLIAPAMVAACLIVAPVFAQPGLGRLFGTSLLSDAPLVSGCLLVYACTVTLVELGADFVLGISDAGSPAAAPVLSGAARSDSVRAGGLSPLGIVAVAVLLVALAGAAGANAIAPAGPNVIDQTHWVGYAIAPGAAGHVLGTDEVGRDLFARLLFALRTSLGIAVLAALIATFVAAVIGAVNGRGTASGSISDNRRPLLASGVRPFAVVPFVIAVEVALVNGVPAFRLPTPITIALAIAAISWPAIVPAFRRFSPAAVAGAVVDMTACALLLEVSLSALGYGVQPPAPSLGTMFQNVQSTGVTSPWVVAIPFGVVVAIAFSLFALGEDLRARSARAPSENLQKTLVPATG